MKLLKISALAILAISLLTACTSMRANQETVDATIETPSFTMVGVAIPGTVHFTQDSLRPVKVQAPHDVLKHLVVRVVDDCLTIETNSKTNFFTDWDSVHVYISSPELKSVQLAGSGTFVADSIDGPSMFSIELAGSGDINIGQLACSNAKLSIAGSGDIKVGLSKVSVTTMDIAGTGDINATCKDCGDIRCSIAGTGDITLKGNARHLEKSISGTGSINANALSL